MVDWLYAHVEGFKERREARKYAGGLLRRGFLRHTVNKVTFSEQCYYVFGDLSGSEWAVEGPEGPAAPAPGVRSSHRQSPAAPSFPGSCTPILLRSCSPESWQRPQRSSRPGGPSSATTPRGPLVLGPGLPLCVPWPPALLPARLPGPWLQLRHCWQPAE